MLMVISSKFLIDILKNGTLVVCVFNGATLVVEFSIVATSVSALCLDAVLWCSAINVPVVVALSIVTCPCSVVILNSCSSPY